MTNTQIKLGITLLLVQVALLALTMSFHTAMDRQAERAGIYTILENGGK